MAGAPRAVLACSTLHGPDMGTIGTITFEWVGPLSVRSKSRGVLQEEETSEFLDVVETQINNGPYFLWEVDVTELTGMTAATRRIVAERLQRMPDRAIAIIGAKFAQRTLAKLVFTAVAMLDRSGRINEREFFNDTESAQAWLNERAARFLSAKGTQAR